MTDLRKVAILCVNRKTHYRDLPGVECYDIDRDARTFAGGMPVVAHPPCRSWSAFLRHRSKPIPGESDLGPMCVEWVQECGGVLEQPAFSRLFAHCDLPMPGTGNVIGWTAEVWACWWGSNHTRKRTWLYFSGIDKRDVYFPLRLWPAGGDRSTWEGGNRHLRSETSLEMCQWLVDIARRSSI